MKEYKKQTGCGWGCVMWDGCMCIWESKKKRVSGGFDVVLFDEFICEHWLLIEVSVGG